MPLSPEHIQWTTRSLSVTEKAGETPAFKMSCKLHTCSVSSRDHRCCPSGWGPVEHTLQREGWRLPCQHFGLTQTRYLTTHRQMTSRHRFISISGLHTFPLMCVTIVTVWSLWATGLALVFGDVSPPHAATKALAVTHYQRSPQLLSSTIQTFTSFQQTWWLVITWPWRQRG